MAGRVQISAVGEQGESLSTNPSFSFFTKRFSKYANYATENFKITFPERVYTNDFLNVPVPQNYGDILQEVTLSFVVDPTNVAGLASNIFPIDVFGISVIDYVELYVGDQKIDTVTSDDMFIERELNIPETYRSSVDMVHGKHFQGSSEREFLQEFYDGQYDTQGIDPFSTNEYRIQIPFYFHRRPGHGFPLCTVYEQELSIRIKLRPAIDVVFTTQEKFDGLTLWDPKANNQVTQQLELSDFKVELSLVHLNTTERCMLRNKPLDILFEQRQRNTFLIEPQSKVGTFNLDFKNCVKELFFIAKKSGQWTDRDISILDELHKLDKLTPSQERTLALLRQISPLQFGFVSTIALDSLVGEDDEVERSAIISALRKSVYWGENFVLLLDGLEQSSIIGTQPEIDSINNLKAYINSIPGQILDIQKNVTLSLTALEGKTDPVVRNGIVQTLLNISVIWGEDQKSILEGLRFPGLEDEAELILALRVFLTGISYYLKELETLAPGSVEQVTLINKILEFLDDTKVQSDILKLGMKAVLNSVTNKSVYLRNRIVDGLLSVGSTIWDLERTAILNLLRTEYTTAEELTTQTGIINGLIEYLDGVYGGTVDLTTIVNSVLDSLPVLTEPGSRDDIIDNLLIIPVIWGDDQKSILEDLREPELLDEAELILALRVFINAQSIAATLTTNVNSSLDDLEGETDSDVRDDIIDNLLNIFVIWGEGQKSILEALKNTELTDEAEAEFILALRVFINAQSIAVRVLNEGIVDELGQFPESTLEVRVARVETLRNFPIWGDEITKLVNEYSLGPYTPTLVGYLEGVLGGIPSVKFTLNLLKGGVFGILDTLPSTPEERDPIIIGTLALQEWDSNVFSNLNLLRTETEPDNDAIYIANIKNSITNNLYGTLVGLKGQEDDARSYIIDGILNSRSWSVSQKNLLEALRSSSANDDAYIAALLFSITSISQYEQSQIIQVLLTRNIWGDEFFTLNDLQQVSPGFIGEANVIATLIAYLVGLDEDGYSDEKNTLNNLHVELSVRNDEIDGLLELEVWGPIEKNLLNGELRIPGSKDHGAIVDGLVNHLNLLAATIYNPPTGLLVDISSPIGADLQDTPSKIAAWGGHFYYLLEALKNPNIIQDPDELNIIAKLKTYVTFQSFSDQQNGNLQFLIRQLAVKYPDVIFNKWVRAKKNVPLMYSKQKTTTLECDGVQILDDTTGSNMFLSASLVNLYHKRTPNFRNINMYSFALYPGELRPSGHLNFSTIKDARVIMELEYDGRHGTFDFDDNYIEVFGIEPIYFPKQVIIIAKSYNMMIIRNGEAKIIY